MTQSQMLAIMCRRVAYQRKIAGVSKPKATPSATTRSRPHTLNSRSPPNLTRRFVNFTSASSPINQSINQSISQSVNQSNKPQSSRPPLHLKERLEVNRHLLPVLVSWLGGGVGRAEPVAGGFRQDAGRRRLTELGAGVNLLTVLEVSFGGLRLRQCEVFGRPQGPLLLLGWSAVLLGGLGGEQRGLLPAGVFPPGGLWLEPGAAALLGAARVLLLPAVGLAPGLGGGTLWLLCFGLQQLKQHK